MTNQEEREDKLTCQIIDILKYQQVITNQGINYIGEKDWALNKIKTLIKSEIDLALANRSKEIVEKIEQFGDIWQLEKTAEETESGCPKFVRVNRDIINLITKDNE